MISSRNMRSFRKDLPESVIDIPNEDPGFFSHHPRLLLATLVVLFLLAIIVRLYKLEAPGLLIERDYTSAILARAFYFERVDTTDHDREQIAAITKNNQPILEPPVTEFLVSLIYTAIGADELWAARLLTSTFWLIGGIFLFKIAQTIVSTDAAVFATAYYLFVPLSILLSRSFQPDSLMMMTFLISLFAILSYYDKPSDLRLVAAGSIVGFTVLHRPLVLFALLSTFIALTINENGSWKGIISKRPVLFFTLSLVPTALYYGYGVLFARFLRWKVETSFVPNLLLHRFFWVQWAELGVDAVGLTALTGALLGVAMLRKGLARSFIVGLTIGYFAFGIVFTVHIHTHGYYHAQLIPIVAIALGPLVVWLANHMRQESDKLYWWISMSALLLLAIFLGSRAVRGGLNLRYQVVNSEEKYKEIGVIVNHSSHTVYVASFYGVPLQYYGELTGTYWPRRFPSRSSPFLPLSEEEISVEERFKNLRFTPEYFVISDIREYNTHHYDLKEYLEESCSLLVANDEYLIFNQCSAIQPRL